jgi:putative membrane protein
MIATTLIGLVAVLHIGFLWLEMFGWTTVGRRVFRGYSKSFFDDTKVLAANQGLYNGFLAAGLIWALLINDAVWKENVASFFLTCVMIAGFYGGVTASRQIILVQSVPAILGLVAVWFLGF